MPIHLDLQKFYSAAFVELSNELHEATPFMKFVAQIASIGVIGAQVVMDSGIFDVTRTLLINVCSLGSPHSSSALALACTSVSSHLATHSEALQPFFDDPILVEFDDGLKAPVRGVQLLQCRNNALTEYLATEAVRTDRETSNFRPRKI
jgi:hypothetical protein